MDFPEKFWKFPPNRESFARLFRYVGPLSTLTVFAALATIYVRSQVIHELGLEANGIYQVVYAISLAYMGLVYNAFNAFGLPKVTELLDDPGKIRRVQNDELRLGLLILCPLVLFAMTTRSLWIPILYSQAFLPAVSFLIWQFIADILRMLRLTMNISLIPLDRFRFILVGGLVDWVGWSLLATILIPIMGIAALPFSYMLIALLSLIIAYVYHRRSTTYGIYRPNKRLLLKAAGLVLPGLFFAQWGVNPWVKYVLPSILILVMLLWMPSGEEYSQLLAFVKEGINKLRKKR